VLLLANALPTRPAKIVKSRLATLLQLQFQQDARSPDAWGPAARVLRSGAMLTILLVILIILAIGSLPTWGYSRAWGYGPSGGLGLVLIVVLVLFLLGRV
jgi:uncharacterized protein DUF3309